MSVLNLCLLLLVIVFCVCAFVSVIQFFVDLKRCSALRSELKDLINRAKLVTGDEPVIKGVDSNASDTD